MTMHLGQPVAISVLACLLGACSTALQPGVLSVGGKPVTFTVSVDGAAFSDKSPITVSIWDETQRQIMDETNTCSVSYDTQTQKETVSCPTGVTYRKATPETYQFTRADLAKGLTINSTTVTVGERYRLSVGGKASDDCNSAGANSEGTANSETIKLADLQVAQTMMGCIGPR